MENPRRLTHEVEVRPCFHRRAEGRLMHPLIHWQRSLVVRTGNPGGRGGEN
jgi:hypothetical protein